MCWSEIMSCSLKMAPLEFHNNLLFLPPSLASLTYFVSESLNNGRGWLSSGGRASSSVRPGICDIGGYKMGSSDLCALAGAW